MPGYILFNLIGIERLLCFIQSLNCTDVVGQAKKAYLISKVCLSCLCKGKSYGSEVYWMDSTADEATLWNRMMISPGEWVEDVLPLRMLMMAR